jgi:FkbM family methyltransferase
MNLSHNLPLYYVDNPNYDRVLPKICKYLHIHDGKMKLIDVGANIGDTAAFVAAVTEGHILCVEGSPYFVSLLYENIKHIKNCHIEVDVAFCSDKDGIAVYKNLYEGGTSKLIRIEDANKKYAVKTLNAIIKGHPIFQDANILKIDTDGFELEVLQGGMEFITAATPVIYFEFAPDILQNADKYEVINKIFPMCYEIGYENSLFYDNFGNVQSVVKTDDMAHILEMVSKIDREKIYYYDILVVHKDKENHRNLISYLSERFMPDGGQNPPAPDWRRGFEDKSLQAVRV